MPIKYAALLLLTSFLWAGNFVVSKGLVGHASPMTLTSLRWLIAVGCLAPLVWLTEKKRVPARKALLPLLLMGISGVALFNILQFLALDHTSATNVGLISTLNAISIAGFSALLLKDRINPLQTGAMLFSLFGVLLVLTKGELTLLLSLAFNQGDLYMLLAVAVWGLYSVFSKWAMAYTTPLMATLYSGAAGLLVLLPINVQDFTVTNINAPFIGAILYTGVISTVVCFVLWNIGVKHAGGTAAGIFLNFNPVFTALLAFLLLGERMSGVQWAGSAVVVSGCFLFSFFKGKKVPERQGAEAEVQTS